MVKNESKNELGFSNIELKIAKPELENNALVVNGNFADVKSKIQDVVLRYKDIVLTEDNVNYIKTLKQQFVSLRTGIERERKEYKKAYLDPPVKLMNAMCDELQRVVAEGEDALTIQLNAYDQKRKDTLTIILKEYVQEAVAKYSLREEYANQIQLLDKYYNKTQDEGATADDIDKQASELAKKQKEYDSAVILIEAECKEANISSDAYIRLLDYKSATEIIVEIKQDKLKSKKQNFANDGVKTRTIKITYNQEQASLIANFFTENNISFEFIDF